MTVLGAAQNVYAVTNGFQDQYDPANWTEDRTPGSNGVVDTSAAPDSITITGSDEGECNPDIIIDANGLLRPENHDDLNCVTDFTIQMQCDGTVSFDWDYETDDSPFFDIFGYLLNGDFTILTDHDGGTTPDSGSESIPVEAGDVFGFRMDATDDCCGEGITDISNFIAPTCMVGGKLIPVEASSLVLAGAQSYSWMLPIALSILGIGLFVFSKRPDNSFD